LLLGVSHGSESDELEDARPDAKFLDAKDLKKPLRKVGLSPFAYFASASSNLAALTTTYIVVPNKVKVGREDLYSCFQLDDGGTRAFNDSVYCFGIIDILQEFNAKKKIESTVPSLCSPQLVNALPTAAFETSCF
jgi:hypothetical protein